MKNHCFFIVFHFSLFFFVFSMAFQYFSMFFPVPVRFSGFLDHSKRLSVLKCDPFLYLSLVFQSTPRWARTSRRSSFNVDLEEAYDKIATGQTMKVPTKLQKFDTDLYAALLESLLHSEATPEHKRYSSSRRSQATGLQFVAVG